MKIILITIMACLMSVTAWGGVLQVPSDYATIQDAIDNASFLDTILLAPGTYSGVGFRNLTSLLPAQTLMSEGGPDECQILLEGNRFCSGGGRFRGISFEGGSRVFEHQGLDVRDCYFIDNDVAIHGGVDIPASIYVLSCTFRGNDTAMYAQQSLSFGAEKSLFLSNGLGMSMDGPEGGIAMYSIFAFNDIAFAGDIYRFANVSYYNVVDGLEGTTGCEVIWPNPPSPNKEYYLADPLFCDTTLLTGTSVYLQSPLLPANNECGVVIGNVEVGLCCCWVHCNVDGIIGPAVPCDVSDLTFFVAYLFTGGPPPPCMEEANVNGMDGPVGPIDVSDLTYLVAYLFTGGESPPPCPE